jgi:hypothetical protein
MIPKQGNFSKEAYSLEYFGKLNEYSEFSNFSL